MRSPVRRSLLSLAGAGLAAPALLTGRVAHAEPPAEPGPDLGAAQHLVPAADRLAFVNTHTGEVLSAAFRVGGATVAAALAGIERLLRDHRTGDAHPIDPALLDQLHRLAIVTGTRAPFQVISGYRSPRSNALLRAIGGGGVAKHSLHMEGRAIDIRLADVPLADLREAAIGLRAGGVGYYPESNFVHVDTGRPRSWG